MRVSTIESDEGYVNWLNRGDKLFIVYLNGEELKSCQTVDEEKGYVLCAKLDEKGYAVIDRVKEEIVYVERFGKVEIKIK